MNRNEILAFTKYNHRICHPSANAGEEPYCFPWRTKEECERSLSKITYPGAFIEERIASTPVDTEEEYRRTNHIPWGSKVKIDIIDGILEEKLLLSYTEVFPAKCLAIRENKIGSILETSVIQDDNKPHMICFVAVKQDKTTKIMVCSIMEITQIS